MTLEGLDTMNFWLRIIAIVSVVQILALGAVACFAYLLYKRAVKVLNDLETRHVALAARVHGVLDEVLKVTIRVKNAEDKVRDKIRQAATVGSLAVEAVKTRSWPIVGIVRAIRVGAETLLARGERRFDRPTDDRRTSMMQGGSDVRATT
jgi:hypothetical protein